MKLAYSLTRTAIATVSAFAFMIPVHASAQTNEPSAHLHAMPPVGSSAAVAPDLMASMHKMHAEMEAMKLSGDMDHDFAMMMRTHHQGAIEMAKIELARGKDKQLKQAAEKMIADQTREIAKLDKWMARHPEMKK